MKAMSCDDCLSVRVRMRLCVSAGTIRMHQEREYPGRVSGTQMTNPDFAALAVAYGGHGELVEATAEFAPAWERCVASGLPSIIECVETQQGFAWSCMTACFPATPPPVCSSHVSAGSAPCVSVSESFVCGRVCAHVRVRCGYDIHWRGRHPLGFGLIPRRLLRQRPLLSCARPRSNPKTRLGACFRCGFVYDEKSLYLLNFSTLLDR